MLVVQLLIKISRNMDMPCIIQ